MNNDEENRVNFNEPIIAIGREEVILDNDNLNVTAKGKKSHGFHLVRSKWDPYPWIESVDSQSSAEISGLRSGDCLLEIDGQDVLGLEMKAIGRLIGKNDRVSLSVWRRPPKSQSEINANFSCLEEKDDHNINTPPPLEGPLPEVARKLVRAVSGIVRALECPVCLESAAPPVSQCVHGHLLCCSCRPKNSRCPVCRVRLGRGRCLLADTSHRTLAEALLDPVLIKDNDNRMPARSLRYSIFGSSKRELNEPEPDRIIRPARRRLLSRLLGGSRNASTESLPAAGCETRPWLLRLHDRRKSASTGELCRAGRDDDEDDDDGAGTDRSGSQLSVPQTPIWGGSFESVGGEDVERLCCPLRDRDDCREPLTSARLMQHLGIRHEGPFVHFYRETISLPLPFPFQSKGLYVLHRNDQIFFMQNLNNSLWISSGERNCGNRWQWNMHGKAENGTEINFKKEVISLHEPFELLPNQIINLSEKIVASSVTISLVEQTIEGGCIKV